MDLVGLCHSGACRGQGQLLGPSNPRLELLMGFKRRPSLCTWSTWHPREVEKGPCATGRFRRHLDGFRHFTVHMDHNEVYIRVCDAKLRPWCNMYLMRSRRDLACIIMARRRPGSTLSQGEIVMRSHEIQGGTEISVRPHRRRNMLYFGSDAPSNVANRPGGRPERSDMCDPSTSIFIHLRVALSGRCHNQLRPDSSWVWKEMLSWLY